ncbi:MAG: SRPBCC domain-containing protein [Propionibacteriaceae bacterium]|nr:SRPBCC domain-containing protein [Propionibacteriaceae bacterium]
MSVEPRQSKPLASITKLVEVACSPERAFDLFTASFGDWWPLTTHSVYGDEAASVVMGAGIGAAIIETSRSGEQAQWGTVTGWQPGQLLEFSWHPGLPLEEATDVRVTFESSSRGTLVTLEHSGWERRRDADSQRAQYEAGWIPVLDRFVRQVN